MNALVAEFLGTLVLIVFGNGVVANVVLAKTKGNGAGWLVITAGWSIAVFVGALCSAKASGAHLNPAVTIGLAVAGKVTAGSVVEYIIAQMLGAMAGSAIVYQFYRDHFAATEDADAKMACFCTSPNLRGNWQSFFCETVGTMMLVLPVLLIADPTVENLAGVNAAEPVKLGLGSLGLVNVALIVFGIGLSLGGTTGYAINPARDLGPRIMHHLLPIANKRDSDWEYAWVPVAGPVLGAIVAAIVYGMIT
ncbi:MAG: MIP/aquaporin family protein [Pirellula sp.]